MTSKTKKAKVLAYTKKHTIAETMEKFNVSSGSIFLWRQNGSRPNSSLGGLIAEYQACLSKAKSLKKQILNLLEK